MENESCEGVLEQFLLYGRKILCPKQHSPPADIGVCCRRNNNAAEFENDSNAISNATEFLTSCQDETNTCHVLADYAEK